MSESSDRDVVEMGKKIQVLEEALQDCRNDKDRLKQEKADIESLYREALDDLNFAEFQLNNLNSVVLRWDPSGKVIYLNEFGKELFGYSNQEIIGESIVGTIIAETDSAGRDLKYMIEDIVKNPQKYKKNENENITKHGQRLWMAWRNKPIRNGDGTLREILTVGYNITEKKQEEKALHDSQKFLETILDNMPVTVFVRDLDGRFMLINRSYEELMQVTKSSVQGKTLHELFPKEEADDYSTLDSEVARQRRVFEREETHQLPDGEHTMAVVKFPIFGQSDEVVAVGGIDIDITERKSASEKLAQKEEQLRIAINGMPNGVVYTDENLDIVIANDRLAEMYGAPTELLEAGRPYTEFFRHLAEEGLFGQIDADTFVAQRTEELRSQSGEVLDRRMPDGRLFEIRRQPVHGGGAITVVTDVTEERKAAEKITRQAESLLELSTPIAEIWNGILLLPVIGELDRDRARKIMNAVLERITLTSSKIVILDISGLSTVDEEVLPHIVMIADAMRLMGSQCIISGVSPTNAKLIVDLGIDVDALFTVANIREALAHGINRLEHQL